MKKSNLLKLMILLLTITTLSSCIVVPVPVGGGYRHGDYYERDRGDYHGDRR